MKELNSKNEEVVYSNSYFDIHNNRRYAVDRKICKGVPLYWCLTSIDYSDIPKIVW